MQNLIYLYLIITMSSLVTLVSTDVAGDVRKRVVSIRPYITPNNIASRQVIADYICNKSPGLNDAIKTTTSIKNTFNNLTKATPDNINQAYDDLNLTFTCFDNLRKVYPITLSNIESMNIRISNMLADINMNLGSAIFSQFWIKLGVNPLSLSLFRLNTTSEEALFNNIMTGNYNVFSWTDALNVIPFKQLLPRIGIFNTSINRNVVTNFVKTYGSDDLKKLMNACGVDVDKLLTALTSLGSTIYNQLDPILAFKTYLNKDITLGGMYTQTQVVTRQDASVFKQSDTFNKYTDLSVVTFDNTRYTVTKREDYPQYTSLTINDTVKLFYSLATSIPAISPSCIAFTSSFDAISSIPIFSPSHVWLPYTSSSVTILDTTPLTCVNNLGQSEFYALSMSNYVTAQNKSIKFDYIQTLTNQAAVVAVANSISSKSGATDFAGSAQGQAAKTPVGQISNNSTQNIAPATSPLGSVQAPNDGANAVLDGSDALLKPTLTKPEVVNAVDNTAGAAQPAVNTGKGAMETAGEAGQPALSNSLVSNTGNTTQGIISGQTSTVGNTAGGVAVQMTNQSVVQSMDKQVGGSVASAGDTASNAGLAQGGTLVGSTANNQVVDTIGNQSNVVQQAAPLADTGSLQAGIGGTANTNSSGIPVVG